MLELNTACSYDVNAACSNSLFSRAIMPSMDRRRPLHPSTQLLYELAAQHGDSRPSQVARRLNVSPQVLKNWESRGVSVDGSLEAQRVYGCDANLLRVGKAEAPSTKRAATVRTFETRTGYVRYQLMNALGGAGPGMINQDYPEVLQEVEIAEWQLREELGRVPSPSRVKLLTVRGDSMSPRIRNGDVVFVDTEDRQYQDGALFVVILHGHALVKRLEIRTDGLHIVSLASPDRPDVVAPDSMDAVHIAGRVLGAIQLRRSEDL